MNVKLVWITPEAEKLIAYCARVSSSKQDNPEISGLLSYCIDHGHWSIFEMANACFEINTSRGITAQIIRHRSFSFQERSTRYAQIQSIEDIEPRRQDYKNRQNSFDDLSEENKKWFLEKSSKLFSDSIDIYNEAIERGIAKECARFLMPMATSSRLYMNGNIRSWIHYLQVRTHPDTQKEHRDIALEIQQELKERMPIIGSVLKW